jgi:hypothetical protein
MKFNRMRNIRDDALKIIIIKNIERPEELTFCTKPDEVRESVMLPMHRSVPK